MTPLAMSQKTDAYTSVFGLIGDPVCHSLSPQIHGYFAELCGINMVYLPFNVKCNAVPHALKGAHALGICGLNVTAPHKEDVMPYLANIDPVARQLGAVNTLLWTKEGYAGYNTDYIGIQRTVKAFGISFYGSTVGIFGAGGTARAACAAAASQGAKCVVIINRTRENAVNLARYISTLYSVPAKVFTMGEVNSSVFTHNLDIVIQTTILGFGKAKDKSPISCLDFFKSVKLTLDVVYTPWETVFLRQAKKSLVPNVVNGFPMLVYQAAASFNLWREHFFNEGQGINDKEMDGHIKVLESRIYTG